MCNNLQIRWVGSSVDLNLQSRVVDPDILPRDSSLDPDPVLNQIFGRDPNPSKYRYCYFFVEIFNINCYFMPFYG